MEYVTFWIWDVRRRAFICLSLIVMCESNFPLLWETVTKNHYPWNGFVWYKKIRVSSSFSECIHICGSSHACAEGKSCDTAFVLCWAQSLVENVQCNRGITQGDIMENPNWYQIYILSRKHSYSGLFSWQGFQSFSNPLNLSHFLYSLLFGRDFISLEYNSLDFWKVN